MDTDLKYNLSSTENPIPTENEQYFVMQNDNDTLTISRQPVQYITQVPAANENLSEPKTSFMQQEGYYLQDPAAFVMSDTNNAAEVGPSNEHYLIQNAAKTSDLQGQETQVTNETVTKNEMDADDVTDTDILGMSNGTTEITLNQEQWQMLEKNGWVLLELNSKIYLLDTLGLHDISDNADLIQKLKNELEVSMQQLEQPENTLPDMSFNAPINSSSETSNLNTEHDELNGVVMPENKVTPVRKPLATKVIRKKNASVRFKTNMKLEEIPDTLVLGTTVNGKRLLAKIVKKPKPIKKLPDTNNLPPVKAICADEIAGNTDSEKARVDQFFKNYLHNLLTPPQSEDIQKAESVINQLLCIKSTRERLIRQNLLVTKNSVPTNAVDCPPQPVPVIGSPSPVFVSGYVESAGLNQWRFKYEPQLLQRIMAQKLNKGISEQKEAIVHVHIEETNQSGDGLTKTSITINKQNIRLLSMLPRKLVHACADCANLFETEEDLKEHRKNPCAEQKTYPEVIYSKSVLDYYIVKPKEGCTPKSYVCKICNATISQRTLKSHVASHVGPNMDGQQEEDRELHECNMCPSLFYHKITLSKHILNCHIRKNYQNSCQN